MLKWLSIKSATRPLHVYSLFTTPVQPTSILPKTNFGFFKENSFPLKSVVQRTCLRNIYGSGEYRRFENKDNSKFSRKYLLVGGGTLLAGIYYYSHIEEVPISKRKRFIDVTPEQEAALGQLSYERIMRLYKGQILPKNHPYSRKVRQVAQRLVAASDLSHQDWEFHVIDSNETNAFAIPGGKIFVFTGILPILQNDDGMAAVLGHEIGHQTARHVAENISFMKIVLLASYAVGIFFDISGSLQDLIIRFVLYLPFSRKCEIEADYIGLMLMSDACFNPTEARKVWERMEQVPREVIGFLSTHPTPKKRIEKIENWMPEALNRYQNSNCQTIKSNFFRESLNNWRI